MTVGPAWVRRALVLVFAAHLAMGAIDRAMLDSRAGDFDRFWDIATSAGQPYRDYPVEYPPGVLLTFKAIARASGGQEAFRVSLLLANLVADAVVMAALAWGWGAEATLCFGLLALPMFTLLFHVDLWSVACTTVAVAAWRRERPWLTAGALLAGTALKLWPLPFAVLLLTSKNHRVRRAPAAAFALALAAFGLYWWFLAGWSGFSQVLTFRGARGWQVESFVGSVLRLLDPASVRVEAGAVRVGRTSGATSIVMFALSAGPSLWAMWRGSRTGRMGEAWLAGVGAMLVCSALLSPQFIGWLLPGAAIAWTHHARRPVALVAAIVLLTAVSPPPVLVVVRNILLLGLTLAAVSRLGTRPATAGDVSVVV